MTSGSVPTLLERLCTLLRSEVRQRGKPHGLQPVQVEALLYLSRCNRYSDTPQAVATYLSSTKGTVSQTIKVLERQGLVAKRPDADDRRIVRLGLTAAGERLARELAVPEALEEVLRADGAREERLAVLLEALLADLQRVGGHRSFGICHSCRFHLREDGGARCGLTQEPLSVADASRICREHEPAEAVT